MSADTDVIDGVTRLLQDHRSRCKCGIRIDVSRAGRDGPDAAMLLAALGVANAVGDSLRGEPAEGADLFEIAKWRDGQPERDRKIREAYEKFQRAAS